MAYAPRGAKGLSCPRIISRSEWGARAARSFPGYMSGKPIYVFIHHGAGNPCSDQASCTREVQGYQKYHMDPAPAGHGWADIGYNFIVGEDGNVYEGRGWREVGAHTYGYNHNGIAICVIGNFNSRVPNDKAQNAIKQLIQCGLAQGHIDPQLHAQGTS
nr:hypothetical protein BaRGS_021774 [Batillaria attramentaria]